MGPIGYGVLVKCVICKKPILGKAQNPLYPFCSTRCRAVDLGKWLGEEYRVPDRHSEEREDEGPPDGREGADA